jgi:hypothetical protein
MYRGMPHCQIHFNNLLNAGNISKVNMKLISIPEPHNFEQVTTFIHILPSTFEFYCQCICMDQDSFQRTFRSTTLKWNCRKGFTIFFKLEKLLKCSFPALLYVSQTCTLAYSSSELTHLKLCILSRYFVGPLGKGIIPV